MRFFKYLFLTILLVFVAGYFSANHMLDKASHHLFEKTRQQAKNHNVQLDRFEYESVRLSSLQSVTWYDADIRFRWSDNKILQKETEFNVTAEKLEVRFVDYSSREVQFVAKNYNVVPTSQAVKNLTATDNKIARGLGTGSVEGQLFVVSTVIDPRSPLQSVKPLVKNLLDIIRKGGTSENVVFKGKVKTRVRGFDLAVNMFSERRDGRTYFVLDPDDVARVSEKFDDKLTPAEIRIIATNPAKAPLLFAIKDYAETKSIDAFESDDSVPQDPYRHVLWSYLLTKEFGPEFAKKITDAHEEGPTGNTAQERKQDYNNNAVGRQYAVDGVQESEVLHRVRTDPNVMRHWNRS